MRLLPPRKITRWSRFRARSLRVRIVWRERGQRFRKAAVLALRRAVLAVIAFVGRPWQPIDISDDLLDLVEKGTLAACPFCGYYHAIECPRVRRVRYRPDPSGGPHRVMEVEFWERWSHKGMLDPEAVVLAQARQAIAKEEMQR